MKNLNTKIKLMILPLTFIVIIICSGLIFAYFSNLSTQRIYVAKETDIFIQEVLKGRISAYQFLRAPTETNKQKVQNDFIKLQDHVLDLKSHLSVEKTKQLADEIISLSKNYIQYFNILANLRIAEFNKGLHKESDEALKAIKEMVTIGLKLEEKLSLINEKALKKKDEAQEMLDLSLILIALLSTLLFVVISLYLSNQIVTSIQNFQTGLLNFFKYLNKESSTTETLDVSSNDEFGSMSKVVNQNILKTKKLLEEDIKLIEDVKTIVEKAKVGILYEKIQTSTSNESLEELKTIFNQMLDVMAENICGDVRKIQTALEKFQQLDFTHRIENSKGKTAEGLNSLAEIINNMLVENKQNGLTLQESSNILFNNVESLSISSNQAAASLEETAAALEEITTNISSTTENVTQMAHHAEGVTKSVNNGQELANQTTKAMDDINNEVTSINEAITVIDQIAFQTNILSLNAAVEAATAGEAGKGFAVVAQEVRNLASRSAEAAGEIKKLVENATNKANSGKVIADEMIEGYTYLNQSIIQTIEFIKDVENASKEQFAGIEQINHAVSELDQQTQQNASVANNTKTIALQTQTIANTVVSNANQKEFIGKDTVKAKSFHSTQNETSHISQPKAHPTTNKNNNLTPINSNTNKDEWASF